MQAIRIRIFIVISLLIVAMGVAGMIYLRGGFSLGSNEPNIGYCGTSSLQPIITNTHGQNLYSANCASCHAIRKDLTGPALAGFDKRISPTLFKLLLTKRKKAYKKSKYLRQLSLKWNNKMEHIVFPSLSEKDIMDIVQYVKEADQPFE